MSISQINPYLFFNGTAEKAMALYVSALGATTETMSRFGEVPGMKIADEHKSRVMHAQLRLGEGAILRLGDRMTDKPAATEGNVQVCIQFNDVEDMKQKFEALAAGGEVTFPVHDTFWGAKFGMLTDAFGIRWMFNCEKQP